MNPIFNPAIPMTANLYLHPGTMIYVTGIPNGDRFAINLKCGPGPQAENAFHFNPRFDGGNVVVRNTMRNNGWETEERECSGFPFQKGQPFEIIILCERHQYKVAVNGRHFIEFQHRIPIQNVKCIQIDGRVTVSMVRFDKEMKNSGQPKVIKINNPVIPHKMVIPYNNIKGKTITIKGLPENREPHKMLLDFEGDNKPVDIFFHFNPRFSNNVLVRNSLIGGCWGKEERGLSIPFPFQYGVPFLISISVDKDCFTVELNGLVICTFNHRRRPLTQIRYVNIGGSVKISEICFNN